MDSITLTPQAVGTFRYSPAKPAAGTAALFARAAGVTLTDLQPAAPITMSAEFLAQLLAAVEANAVLTRRVTLMRDRGDIKAIADSLAPGALKTLLVDGWHDVNDAVHDGRFINIFLKEEAAMVPLRARARAMIASGGHL